ncbi:hypothetical protein [Brevibacillus massiliensis]|uniref:hypothetical protein n=1 Tax=Brevibacillus massiliensis TaxID=1118054 RepID=UPI0002E5C420|nr:hypothetical protein [Brevibacillus massiliensis]
MHGDELTLIYHGEPNSSFAELKRRGFHLLSSDEAVRAGDLQIDGHLLLQEADAYKVCRLPVHSDNRSLVLLYGDRVRHDLADRMNDLDGFPYESVRLLLFEHDNRAVIGGTAGSVWVDRLRRLLARQGLISLVCRGVEVDEIARHLPVYLEWKHRFYQLMGAECDRSGARLSVVAQALGMDKRVGQGWLMPLNRLPMGCVVQETENWLHQQWQLVQQKTNIEVLAFWGQPSPSLAKLLDITQGKQVRLYSPAGVAKTNVAGSGWEFFDSPLETLLQADVLLITDADQRIREAALEEITRRMRSPIVLDACSCYPLAEAEAAGLAYRTYGQNTNIWNGAAYNRV